MLLGSAAAALAFALACCGAPRSIADPAPASAPQQDAAAIDLQAAAVLAHYKAATGGAAWDSVRTMDTHLDLISGGDSSGSEEWDDILTGRTVIFSKNDNTHSVFGYDGKREWEKYNNDPAIYSDDQGQQEENVTDAYQLTNSYWYTDRMPAAISYTGQTTYKKALYDVVDVQPQGGADFQMWINHATGLMDVLVQVHAMYTETSFLSKYRPVSVPGAGSVLIPFETEYDQGKTEPGGRDSIKSVMINMPPPPGIFDAPTQFKQDYSFRQPGENSTTVPIQYVEQQIQVPIKVNGAKETALFDTGAAFILTQYAAYQLRIPVSSGAEAQGNGARTVQAGYTFPDDMEVGDMKLKKPIFEVIGSYNDPDVPAIIGAELLRRFVVTVDFNTMTMTLTEPSAFHYSGNGVVVPFRIHDSHMPIVDGSIDGVPGTFVIDTGDSIGLTLNGRFNMTNDLKDKYQPKFAAPAGYGVGGPDYAYIARAKTVTLGGATINDPVVYLRGGKTGAGADRYVAGAVGMPQLHQFNLIFDYPDEKMILEPNKSYPEPENYNRTGLVYDLMKPDLVGQVIPGSAADAAGIQAGDTILSIDGVKREYKKESMEKYIGFDNAPAGSSLTVVYKHPKGGTRTATLVLRDLV